MKASVNKHVLLSLWVLEVGLIVGSLNLVSVQAASSSTALGTQSADSSRKERCERILSYISYNVAKLTITRSIEVISEFKSKIIHMLAHEDFLGQEFNNVDSLRFEELKAIIFVLCAEEGEMRIKAAEEFYQFFIQNAVRYSMRHADLIQQWARTSLQKLQDTENRDQRNDPGQRGGRRTGEAPVPPMSRASASSQSPANNNDDDDGDASTNENQPREGTRSHNEQPRSRASAASESGSMPSTPLKVEISDGLGGGINFTGSPEDVHEILTDGFAYLNAITARTIINTRTKAERDKAETDKIKAETEAVRSGAASSSNAAMAGIAGQAVRGFAELWRDYRRQQNEDQSFTNNQQRAAQSAEETRNRIRQLEAELESIRSERDAIKGERDTSQAQNAQERSRIRALESEIRSLQRQLGEFEARRLNEEQLRAQQAAQNSQQPHSRPQGGRPHCMPSNKRC